MRLVSQIPVELAEKHVRWPLDEIWTVEPA